MTCEISFEVSDEIAEQIVESIDGTVSSGQESWTFNGDFTIPEALELRNDLQQQLNDGS